LALKLAKNDNISKKNCDPELEFEEKSGKGSPKKSLGEKLLHTVIKVKLLYFSVTFLLIRKLFCKSFFATPSTDSKSD
jgi:hypothetical protein